MATEVLRPQDCLIRSQRRSIHGRINNNRKNNNVNNKVVSQQEQVVLKSSQVTILRRGEPLNRRSKVDIYAGSAFLSTSPPPASSLPLPSFSKKLMTSAVVVDDSATRDLRRLLRLE